MTFNRDRLIRSVGRRILTLRKQFDFSTAEFARRLGLSRSGYFKNENGVTFPRMSTLHFLQGEFDISMDWLIFNKGPVHYSARQPKPVDNRRTIDLDEVSPDLGELLEYMAKDRLLKHEVLSYFYKYKEKKEARVSPEPPSTPTING